MSRNPPELKLKMVHFGLCTCSMNCPEGVLRAALAIAMAVRTRGVIAMGLVGETNIDTAHIPGPRISAWPHIPYFQRTYSSREQQGAARSSREQQAAPGSTRQQQPAARQQQPASSLGSLLVPKLWYHILLNLKPILGRSTAGGVSPL